MRIYLDDDTTGALLVKLLRGAGHDVSIPKEFNLAGREDPVHLRAAIRDERVLLTQNHSDFEVLHDLVLESKGRHPGIFVIRKDNDSSRDLTERGIVNAIAKLLSAGVSIPSELHVLNHWR